MPVRSFDADAQQATVTSLPVPRGIAFRYDPPGRAKPTAERAKAATVDVLNGWEIREFTGLPSWFEALPPSAAAPQPILLGDFWRTLRSLRSLADVKEAEPLFLIANSERETGIGFGQEQFGLWGWPYDDETVQEIEQTRKEPDWHLSQMKVREAWVVWQQEHPGVVPGDGIVVGHPDTGRSSAGSP
jgi:hypothetical protein